MSGSREHSEKSSGDPPTRRRRAARMASGELSTQGLFAEDLPTLLASATTAEAVVKALDPEASPAVFARLSRERVRTPADLAGLSHEDLQHLGLSMVARSRVLRWAREAFPTLADPIKQVGSERSSGSTVEHEYSLARMGRCSSIDERPDRSHKHLEEIERKSDFWCSVVKSWTGPQATRCRRALQGSGGFLQDVRENLLESLCDLSPDRVREVYESLVERAGPSGRITAPLLEEGLRRCGLPEPEGGAVAQQVLEAVVDSPDGCLQLCEFETILCRLMLAQLVGGLQGGNGCAPSPASTTASVSTSSTSAGKDSVGPLLSVVDYNVRGCHVTQVAGSDLTNFFFGRRPAPKQPGDLPLVRWVHLKGLDLMLLLALTVKYSLHPLAVEDTIQQGPSKTDRYGSHYLTTIEGLCLVNGSSTREPVQVRGHHVAVFCAGPPQLDTIITVSQPDSSFAADWPGGYPEVREGGMSWTDAWVERILRRLEAPLSRLRERRADFLLYAAADVCADEIVAVVKAYSGRLSYLEAVLRGTKEGLHIDRLNEVSMARQQMGVVARRVRGLQRVVRRIIDDPDLGADLSGYLQDIIEHLEDANDDLVHLSARCVAIAEAQERADERRQEHQVQAAAARARREELRRSLQADRQNNILLVLTIVTTVFAPVQFIAGVYGMNFVDPAGRPSIPELTWRNGYLFFWVVVVSYLMFASAVSYGIFQYLHRAGKRQLEALDAEAAAAAAAAGTPLSPLTERPLQVPLLSGRAMLPSRSGVGLGH